MSIDNNLDPVVEETDLRPSTLAEQIFYDSIKSWYSSKMLRQHNQEEYKKFVDGRLGEWFKGFPIPTYKIAKYLPRKGHDARVP